ncbi:tellurium resistance protein [Pseudogemmobacter humi]|nr:tellurium resistance protein [Pseudogemmobacter humi]
MPQPTVRPRPRAYPPPEFPPRRAALFARTPSAVFPVILGLCGLQLALRTGLAATGLAPWAGDLLAGLVLPLIAFALFAYGVKIVRRAPVIMEDIRVVPSRAGLGAAGMAAMASAAILAPYAPGLAQGVLILALAAHGVLALLVLRGVAALPPGARGVDPGWHLIFTGPVVGALAAAMLGLRGLSVTLFFLALAAALAIMAVSLVQLIRRVPPAPLRPMLAIHLAPMSLFSSVAVLNGWPGVALGFAALAVAILAALSLAARWITAAGFSPLWGAFTFPLSAFAGMLFLNGATVAGWLALAAAGVVVPLIAWRVLRLWPGGRLAALTNAAEA